MADVAKVITIIGSSPESFAKAADAAVQEAAKTVRGISGAHVVSMSALVEGDRISQYRSSPGCDGRSLGRTQGASISVDMGATA